MPVRNPTVFWWWRTLNFMIARGEEEKSRCMNCWMRTTESGLREAVQPWWEGNTRIDIDIAGRERLHWKNVARIINEKEIHSLFLGKWRDRTFEGAPEEVRAGISCLTALRGGAKVISGSQSSFPGAATFPEKACGWFFSRPPHCIRKKWRRRRAEALLRAGVPSVVAFNTVVFGSGDQ